MEQLRRLFGILCTVLLLYPSSVELSHVFAKHEHPVCSNFSDGHFHQQNADCELFDFQNNPYSSPELVCFQTLQLPNNLEPAVGVYAYLSTSPYRYFSLRAPPVRQA